MLSAGLLRVYNGRMSDFLFGNKYYYCTHV